VQHLPSRTSESKGHWQIQNSSAAYDLKFLLPTRRNIRRNFKSAALAPHDFAVRSGYARQREAKTSNRIPLATYVTIAIRPSGGAGRRVIYYCFGGAEKRYFGFSEINLPAKMAT
jgi:hypothetical protein